MSISDDVAISVRGLKKLYKLYGSEKARLKEALNPFNRKYHTEFYAMNGVSFDIKKGEIIGIVGKNGAGKSTLLKMITGVVTPTQGDIKVNGKISSLLELGAGFNPEMTGLENIYLNGTIVGLSAAEMQEKLPSILSFADIGDFIHQPVKMYSSGMFARLAFAVAVNVDPDILIIDEALSVGDLRFQLKCMERFDQFRSAGKTILFVSHDLSAIKRFCSRCIWINNGQVEAIGNVNYITDRYSDYLKENDSDDRVIDIARNDIAEIRSLKLIQHGNYVDEISFGEPAEVEVEYVVNSKISQPVLGIAIYSIDNKYICGLNTLLDSIEIPWELGVNKMTLKYKQINLLGGTYHFDTALFEKNAMVILDHKAKYKAFVVKSPYVGEGVYIINHEWLSSEKI
ncbi:MAG: ABC transporter ATP-binding protein [Turicibacter sp.]